MPNKKCQKNAKKYYCEKCDFVSNKKSNYEIHLQTKKHNTKNPNEKNAKIFLCKCGKKYKHMSTYCNHKKDCIYEKKEEHTYNNGQMAKNGKKMAKNGKISKNVHFEKNQNSEYQKLYICECGKSYK